ncbi:unnamed protein product [marine sediment metagenome]|uniref:Uncharacterized protein n=1 Tax=marine sediment metagenome TaxID=412755 RepID=X0WL47_9ZZZZ
MAEFYIPAGIQNPPGKQAESIQYNGDIFVEIYVSTVKISGYLLLQRLEKSFVVSGSAQIL